MPFLHYYCMLIKFGMGRATWDAAQEIRSDKITREEGIALVNEYAIFFLISMFGGFFLTRLVNYK